MEPPKKLPEGEDSTFVAGTLLAIGSMTGAAWTACGATTDMSLKVPLCTVAAITTLTLGGAALVLNFMEKNIVPSAETARLESTLNAEIKRDEQLYRWDHEKQTSKLDQEMKLNDAEMKLKNREMWVSCNADCDTKFDFTTAKDNMVDKLMTAWDSCNNRCEGIYGPNDGNTCTAP